MELVPGDTAHMSDVAFHGEVDALLWQYRYLETSTDFNPVPRCRRASAGKQRFGHFPGAPNHHARAGQVTDFAFNGWLARTVQGEIEGNVHPLLIPEVGFRGAGLHSQRPGSGRPDIEWLSHGNYPVRSCYLSRPNKVTASVKAWCAACALTIIPLSLNPLRHRVAGPGALFGGS